MAHEPFIDFDAVTEEQAEKLQDALRMQEMAKNHLVLCDESVRREAASMYLQSYHDVQEVWGPLMHELFTIPVFVHTAGERHPAEDDEVLADEAPEGAWVQKCDNCGTVLASWMPGLMQIDAEGHAKELTIEDADFYEPGVKCAKEADVEAPVVAYAIDPPDRELKKHEQPCVGKDSLGL